jgi:hypothetical protein
MRAAVVVAIVLSVGLSACTGAVSSPSSATASLAGRYEIRGTYSNGKHYLGDALITPRGEGYDVSWYYSQRRTANGFGIQVGDVFGVLWSANDYFLTGSSVIAYRIAGGELTGIRLSAANPDGGTRREVLKGAPDLAGRYQIVSSVNPYGATLHSGFVEIERRGEAYAVTWYTPDQSYVGSGIRVGDVLVVAYAHSQRPGVIAYCVGNGILQGSWADPGGAPTGRETLRKAGKDTGGTAECR